MSQDIPLVELLTTDSVEFVVTSDTDTEIIEVGSDIEIIEVNVTGGATEVVDPTSYDIITETLQDTDTILVDGVPDIIIDGDGGSGGVTGGDLALLDGKVTASQVDQRGLNVKDSQGNDVFSSTGRIADTAYVEINGNQISLSEVASAALIPSLNFVGTYSYHPIAEHLGPNWLQNAVYKNSTDGNSYVLTGNPLRWVIYLTDGSQFSLIIESTNGTVFRVGNSSVTLLKARFFKNGAEVTDQTPAAWFRWRRSSGVPREVPYDDTTWNTMYQTGYKTLLISIDDVKSRATFFCDIISP